MVVSVTWEIKGSRHARRVERGKQWGGAAEEQQSEKTERRYLRDPGSFYPNLRKPIRTLSHYLRSQLDYSLSLSLRKLLIRSHSIRSIIPRRTYVLLMGQLYASVDLSGDLCFTKLLLQNWDGQRTMKPQSQALACRPFWMLVLQYHCWYSKEKWQTSTFCFEREKWKSC